MAVRSIQIAVRSSCPFSSSLSIHLSYYLSYLTSNLSSTLLTLPQANFLPARTFLPSPLPLRSAGFRAATPNW